MEVKREERMKRLPTPPGQNYYSRSDLVSVLFSSRKGKLRRSYKAVYGQRRHVILPAGEV